MKKIILALVMIFTVSLPVCAYLNKDEVLVVYNSHPDWNTGERQSKAVADYYCRQRNIPDCHKIGISVEENSEIVSPDSFHTDILQPLESALTALGSDSDDPANDPIKAIVLCYGIPTKVQGNGIVRSVDSCLTLLFNETNSSLTLLNRSIPNPYYQGDNNASPLARIQPADFGDFRSSAYNSVWVASIGGPPHYAHEIYWKMRYLVTRLDGLEYPLSNVTIDGVTKQIPTDVKNIIDKAITADSIGRAALDGSKWIIDTRRTTYLKNYTSIAGVIDQLVQDGTQNVWYDYYSTTFLTGMQDVLGYMTSGSYHSFAQSNTTWWRPFNVWKPGAVAACYNVSGDARYVRTPTFIWGVTLDNSALEAGKAKIYITEMNLGTANMYSTHWIGLHNAATGELVTYGDGTPVKAYLNQATASFDLANITFPASVYIALHFPDNDSHYSTDGVGDVVERTVNISSATMQSAVSSGITYAFTRGQSLGSALIRDGATATTGNVEEPMEGNSAHTDILLAQYATGRTFAECAWMSIPKIPHMQIAIGDPLMSPFKLSPTISFGASAPENYSHITGTVSLAASAVADGSGSIANSKLWLINNNIRTLLASSNSASVSCSLNTANLADGPYTVEAVADQAGNIAGRAIERRTFFVSNDSNVEVVGSLGALNSLDNNTRVMLTNIPVSAGTSDTMQGAFYVEDANRINGIRVETDLNNVYEGMAVTVSGTLHKSGNNIIERKITANNIWTIGYTASPAPLGMGNDAVGGTAPANTAGIVGGSGVYNTGKLVKVWGEVTYVGNDFIYIDDGSNLADGNTLGNNSSTVNGMRVYFAGLAKPSVGDYVTINGVSSTYLIGENIVRNIRLRKLSDVNIVAYAPAQENMMLFSANSISANALSEVLFRPNAGLSAEEILASSRFASDYNAVGAIGNVLGMNDGANVTLIGECVSDIWSNGTVLGLREWFEPYSATPNICLCLNNAATITKDATIDVVGATLTTLANGQRALINPQAVYVYTDAVGRVAPPPADVKNINWAYKVNVCR